MNYAIPNFLGHRMIYISIFFLKKIQFSFKTRIHDYTNFPTKFHNSNPIIKIKIKDLDYDAGGEKTEWQEWVTKRVPAILRTIAVFYQKPGETSLPC